MSVLYFANVGNRDVKHAEINQVIPRLSGKEWLDDYDNRKTKLNFPILRNGLGHALEQLNGKPIDKLFLFYTDQKKETVIERHYQSDTIFFAEIIKRLIAEQMSDRVKSVNLVRIDGAPNDYDEMYRFYGKELETICKHEKADCTFFAPAGGTPACNMTMVLHGSRIFQHKSRVILISETPGSTPKSLNISSEIIRNHNRKALEKMAEHYDFGGIVELLREDERPAIEQLCKLAECMQYRLYFDFKDAQACLDAVNQDIVPKQLQDLVNELSGTLKPLLEEKDSFSNGVPEKDRAEWIEFQKKLLMEISVNARVKWNAGQYVDFLGRMFRLQEGILRIFFEEQTGYSTDKDRYPEDFQNWCTIKGEEFIRHFESNPYNGQFKSIPSRKALLEFMRYWAKTRLDHSEILTYCNKIDHLASLRNQSILAHGNKPISVETVERIYGKKVWQNVAKIARIWDLTDNYQQFDLVLNIIKENY